MITSNLTGLPSSVVRYRGHNEKGSSIFTRNHELFCLLDKHYSPLLAKKVDYTKKWEFDIPSSPWQSGAKGEWRVSSCWRYKWLQFIWQMFFLINFPWKKRYDFPQFSFFRFCRDNFVKLLKIRTVNLFLLPANSALRMFAVKSEKNL